MLKNKQSKEEQVHRIVVNVMAGVRTKAELRRCGCGLCVEALRRLKEAGK